MNGCTKREWEIYWETKLRLERLYGEEHDTKSIVRLSKEIDEYRKMIYDMTEQLHSNEATLESSTLESKSNVGVEVYCSDIYEAENVIDKLNKYDLYLKIIVDPNLIKNT